MRSYAVYSRSIEQNTVPRREFRTQLSELLNSLEISRVGERTSAEARIMVADVVQESRRIRLKRTSDIGENPTTYGAVDVRRAGRQWCVSPVREREK